jgi:hypothetical protein
VIDEESLVVFGVEDFMGQHHQTTTGSRISCNIGRARPFMHGLVMGGCAPTVGTIAN